MLIDLAGEIPAEDLACDICIVGAGPAGIVLAVELIDSGMNVILLEAGGEKPDAFSQSFFDGKSVNRAHPDPSMYRQRRAGGASTIWGGRCIPLDPIDFEKRDWVSLSGWPIAYEHLIPFYERAQDVLDAGAFDYGSEAVPSESGLVDGFVDGAVETDRIERFSLPTNVFAKYRKALMAAPNVRCFLNAACVDLPARGNFGGVSGCMIATPSGERRSIRAGRVVVAAGGLETYRLLANSWFDQGGIGNHSDFLGRTYMCHLELSAGTLKLLPKDRPVSHSFEMTRDGIYARRKFTLSPQFQRDYRLLNASIRLHHPGIVDPSHRDGILSLMYLAKNTVIPEYRRKLAMVDHAAAAAMTHRTRFWAGHLRNVALGAPRAAIFSANWIWRHSLAERKLPYVALKNREGRYSLDMNVEQEPQRASRVTLSSETDRHGLRRLSIDWKMSELDIATARAAYSALSNGLATSGVGVIEESLADLNEAAMDAVAVGGHHIGLARMSDDPARGVVDADCKVHGLDNLYVAGAAVFPTSGHANPTLTIVALALRLADRLKRDAK